MIIMHNRVYMFVCVCVCACACGFVYFYACSYMFETVCAYASLRQHSQGSTHITSTHTYTHILQKQAVSASKFLVYCLVNPQHSQVSGQSMIIMHNRVHMVVCVCVCACACGFVYFYACSYMFETVCAYASLRQHSQGSTHITSTHTHTYCKNRLCQHQSFWYIVWLTPSTRRCQAKA